MTRINYIILLTLFFFNFSFGQNFSPTKRQLLKTFRKSIRQDKKLHAISNPWVICNKDSSFFKVNTIQLINNENYYYHSDSCCAFIDWTFYKKNRFIQETIDICKEPPSASVATSKDFYTIKLSKTGNDLITVVTNSINLTQKYKILSIDNIKVGNQQNLTSVVNLLRIK